MNAYTALSAQIDATTPARDKILFTAHDLFYRDGIRATGIDRIIADARVTKTTFYRHFPSKHQLIIRYLELRHERFLALLRDRLSHHGGDLDAICPTLSEWFNSDSFRGCAFINSVSELGAELPEVLEITRRHKQDVVDIILSVVPPTQTAPAVADALGLAIEGAIIKAQYDKEFEQTLEPLGRIIRSLAASQT